MTDLAWKLADLHKVRPNGIKVMSTFCCGGGSSMGYKLAGCEIVAANDIDPEMAWHYRENLHPPRFFLAPIRKLIEESLPEELSGLDILDGSPPCSSFSISGLREKTWGKEKRFREGQAVQVLDDLFFNYLDLVDRLRPKVSIAENVRGMLVGKAKGYTKAIMRRYREIGYRPQLFLVNAADCGVPQRRERVFFCAVREDLDVPKLRIAPRSRWIPAGEALADLPDLTPAERAGSMLTTPFEIRMWEATKPGQSYKDTRLRWGLSASLWNYKKLSRHRTAPTLMASGDPPRHWAERRYLTFREMKRLGSFPDDYKAKSERVGSYMIGMSVPPRMTETVARAVCAQWLGTMGD